MLLKTLLSSVICAVIFFRSSDLLHAKQASFTASHSGNCTHKGPITTDEIMEHNGLDLHKFYALCKKCTASSDMNASLFSMQLFALLLAANNQPLIGKEGNQFLVQADDFMKDNRLTDEEMNALQVYWDRWEKMAPPSQ